ncbi:hypothetical protein FUAX_05870 [Fulvitalea axinellae]|uniref:DUF3108 domain-containing protein n=1 Tax=Fulvitalea axinellae TaxID=1182444 RepID=A0AAU9DBJ5_9BACT|nr:hypothetical protein FUAX_05870 [Fulvitalea axinellae]
MTMIGNRTFFMTLATLLLSTVFSVSRAQDSYRERRQHVFAPGEEINYKLQLGFINVGEADVTVSKKLYESEGRPCFNMQIHGRTTGVFSLAAKVDDYWGTYMDTLSLVPHQFYMRLRELSYRKQQVMRFDHKNDSVYVEKRDKRSGKYIHEKVFSVPNDIQDIISGFYYLRTLNFDSLKKGDTFVVPGFFDDSVYYLNIRLLEREVIKTRIGKRKALVLAPYMPKNELFDKGKSIKVWISDDRHRIPLKIRAKMMIGAAEVNIRSYKPGNVSLNGKKGKPLKVPKQRKRYKKKE